MDITEQYTEYCYNNYYKKSTNWEAYDEHLAEKEEENYE